MRFKFVWKKRKEKRPRKLKQPRKLKKGKRIINIVKKLPDDPGKGEVYVLIVKNPLTKKKRLVHFESTGKEGFGKWKTIKNEPYT